MVLTNMVEVAEETINSHFLSKPKIVLHFFNDQEDRRIPFVLSNVTYVDGKCFFSGKYTYRLDMLFWKTRNTYQPFDMYLNFGFADFYVEKINVDLTPEVFETDDKCYGYTFEGNHFRFLPNKKKIHHTPVSRFCVGFVNFLIKIVQFIFSVVMLPVFIIDSPNAVLIPVPQSSGKADYTLELANTIRIIRQDCEVVDILSGTPRKKLYDIKKTKTTLKGVRTGLKVDESADCKETLQSNSNVYLLDNVVNTGFTFNRARKEIGRAHV